MQKNKNEIYVFVQTDLLIQEKLFELLRECILCLDVTRLALFDEFCYDAEKDKVVQLHSTPYKRKSNSAWMCEKLENGHIFTSLASLEKILSL